MSPRVSILRRRTAAVAIGVALALVAFELVGQVGAYVLWSARRGAGHDGATDILCIGDSFTFGLGAGGPEGSYPKQLEDLLGGDHRVVNVGYPAQDSRAVLLALARQLERHRPRVVYTLVGYNDPWRFPARVTAEEGAVVRPATFPLRWRTGRLMALFAAWCAGEGEDVAPAFVGTWHAGALAVAFAADGKLVIGPRQGRWSLRGEQLEIGFEHGSETAIDWRLDDGALVLAGGAFGPATTCAPGPPPTAPLERAHARLRDGDHAGARDLFAALIANDATGAHVEAAAHAGMVAALTGLDDREAAATHLAWLRRAFDERPTAALAGLTARALLAVGELDAALDAAGDAIALQPSQPDALAVLAKGGAAGKIDALADGLERAVQSTPRGTPMRVELLFSLAASLRVQRPQRALQALLRAATEGASDEQLTFHLIHGRDLFTAQRLDDALQTAEAPTDLADRMRSLLAGARDRRGGVREVLAHHLTLIVELCRRSGAEPVLLTYPRRNGRTRDQEEAVRAVAGEAGCDWIWLQPVFDAALEQQPASELFVSDGHCSKAGYGLIAATVAPDAQARLPR